MKNLNLKFYGIGFLLFISSILVFNLNQLQNSLTPIFIGIVIAIGLFNTSGIFFYKTLNTNDEIKKYMFSFIHIVLLISIAFPFM